MPTFTSVALDRLIEPGTVKTMAAVKTSSDPRLGRKSSTPNTRSDKGTYGSDYKLEMSVSLPNSMSHRKNVTSPAMIDREYHWTQISPALYATPEPTPLPDSPTSFIPSPYVVNHKRRGPRLLKSFSQDDVAIHNQVLNEKKVDENGISVEKVVSPAARNESSTDAQIEESQKSDVAPSVHGSITDSVSNGELCVNDSADAPAVQNGTLELVTSNMPRNTDTDDFFEPQESLSVMSNADTESSYGVEQSANVSAPPVEFYDAWDELSSESGPQPSMTDLEAELREIRLSLLMEIEKRKETEEKLNTMQARWIKIREELSAVGLTLPLDPIVVSKDEEQNDPAEELSQQLFLARFVSNSIGRGTAKAEIEMEMEAKMELKNFEIARLLDRLRYYEAVNREMSHRNQETVETARRLRKKKKRQQRLIWMSIAGALTLGTAFLAWSYLPNGKESYSSHTPEENQASG